MSESLKQRTARGLLWGGLNSGAMQLLNLLFGIFLARLLDRSDYGMVGMLTIFSSIAGVLQEGGFISAIANKRRVGHDDLNAVFWFSTLAGTGFYLILFFCAPLIARFYGVPELTPLSRFVFIGFLIAGIGTAPRAKLFRELKVKQNTIVSLIALISSGCTGIALAASGMAYWGLAIQSVVYVTVIVALNFFFSHWHPTLHIDLRPLRGMIGFSSRMVVTKVFNVVNDNLFSMVLGRLYTPREVGDFSQANKWNAMGHGLITGMVNNVAQPVLASVADDPRRQLKVFRKMIRFTAFLSFPALLGLSIVASELITLTITAKWTESAHILSLLCVWGAFAPLNNLFSNLLISRGRSQTYMWCTIALSLLQLAAAIAVHSLGLTWMLRVFVTIHIGWLLVWFTFVHREIGLTLLQLLRDISPYLLLSAALAAGTWLVAAPIDNIYLRLLAKILIMAGLYALVLYLADSVIFRESLHYILGKKR